MNSPPTGQEPQEEMNAVHDHYLIFVRGANGVKRLGWHEGTPEVLFEEVVEEEIDDNLGEFIDATFRRDNERDVLYKADNTWSAGELFVPIDPDANIKAMIASLSKHAESK